MSAVDPQFLPDAAKAAFIVQTGEAHGVDFAIADGRLAVTYPLSLEPASWASFQTAILDNKEMIARLVLTRQEGRP
jgi:hypothetical protein